MNLRDDAAVARPHFTAAARLYDQAWSRGIWSLLVARNRAHAHYLAGDVPRAVLAFRDGLVLFPWDATLQRELAECRAAVAYPDPAAADERTRPEPPADLRHRLSPADLFWASAVASALLAVGVAARFTVRPVWWPLPTAVGLTGVALAAASAWQIDRETRREREHPVAVVARGGATLRTGNADAYPARVAAPLPAGAEVRVVGRRGGWVQVELAGGAVGWLPGSAVVGGEDASSAGR